MRALHCIFNTLYHIYLVDQYILIRTPGYILKKIYDEEYLDKLLYLFPIILCLLAWPIF